MTVRSREPDDETLEDRDDPLLRALARTPEVTPFNGTERYQVLACLGEGGFGVVYEVEDRQLGRRLALKTLKAHRSGFAANIRRLKREFRSVADLVHPNLVGLHELSSDGARWFFTMELVRGCDFLAHVRGASAAEEDRLRASLRQLISGVGALHQAGIVHRDLKPSNVLVEPDGRLVILDFGLAGGELAGDPEILLAGTPVYMAPEQAGGQAVTGAADWYAVGVMLHQALTGAMPAGPGMPGGSLREHGDLGRLCEALLRREPGARPDAAAIREVLGAPRAEPRRAALGSAFVGRTRELSQLEEAFAAVQGGEPVVLRLHGQPGVGKSALLAQFVDELVEDGQAAVLAARCHERESVPFKAFDGVADALVRYLQALPRNQATGLLPRDIHLVTQLFPVFDGVAAIRDVPRRQSQVGDPRELRLRAFAAIKELIARVADKQPLVIAIDDLQWGDIDSARLLAQLVAPPERPALLLLLCYRADEAEQSPTLRETLRLLEAAGQRGADLALDPLPSADAERLAAWLLGQEPGASQAARTIAQRGEGHPLFMAELARALMLRDEGPPPSLMDILWQRVARLPDDARALLETVAVAGQPLPSSLCFEAAGLGGGGVDAMRLLRAEQLLRAGDGGDVNVFHDRIRDAVLARAEPGAQRRRHLALARSLERLPEPDVEALARHFDAAGEREQTAHYALRAADTAMQALAFERAAALYRMAIDRGAGIGGAAAGLHEKLGHALQNAGCSKAAGEAYLSAAVRADGPQSTGLARLAAEHLLVVGDIEVGYRALDRALAGVGESLPASLARANLDIICHSMLVRLRGTRFRQRDEASIPPERLLRLDVLDSAARGLDPNDPPRAIALRGRFHRMAMRTGEPRRAALGLIGSIFLVLAQGSSRPAIADQILDAAEAIGRRLGDAEILARVMLMRGMTHMLYSDWHRATELLERASAMISEQCAGMASEQHNAMLNAGFCRVRAGQLAGARRVGERLLLDAVERDDPVTEKNVCAAVMAPLSLAAGDPAAALEFVQRVAMEDRCPSVLLRAESTAAVATYMDRPRDAVEAWRTRWQRIEEMGVLVVPGFRVFTVRSLASALLARPQRRREIREAARLARSIRRLRFPHARAAHAGVLACLAMHGGQRGAAAAHLRRASEQYDEADMALEASACRHRLGEIVGGEEGDAAVLHAQEELRAGGIASPERWVAMFLPPLVGLDGAALPWMG